MSRGMAEALEKGGFKKTQRPPVKQSIHSRAPSERRRVAPPPEPIVEERVVIAESTPAPIEPPPVPPPLTLRDRLVSQIEEADRIAFELLASQEAAEKRAKHLKGILQLVDEQGLEVFEQYLHSILPPQKKPVPTPPSTDRIIVTRQRVLEIANAFQEKYTLDEMVEVLVQGHTVAPEEKRRVRRCVHDALEVLMQRGEVGKVESGSRSRAAIYGHPQERKSA